MRDYGYSVTEHDPEQPRIVVGTEHHTIRLLDGINFFEWAKEHSRVRAGLWTRTRGR
jgi:hypothetical protein